MSRESIGSLQLKETEPATNRQKLAWEKELLGLYVSGHPLAEHKDILEKQAIPINHISSNIIGKTVKVGGIVLTIKKIMTKKGQVMAFANLQDLKNQIELVVFPETLEKIKDI